MSETEQKLTEPMPDQNGATSEATADMAATDVAVKAVTPERKKEPPKGARSYELIFLVSAGLQKEELNALIEKIQNFLEQQEGVVENIRISDVRKLAYEIKKQTHGIYVVFNFWLSPHSVAELERILKLDERVLRYMVIKTRT